MNRIKDTEFKYKIASIIVIIFLLAIGATIVLNFTFSANKVNTFYEVDLVDANVEGIKIYNVDMKQEDGITRYDATIKATEDITIKYINIIIKDENNDEIVRLLGYVGTNLKKNEIKEIEASTDADLENAYIIEYEVVK